MTKITDIDEIRRDRCLLLYKWTYDSTIGTDYYAEQLVNPREDFCDIPLECFNSPDYAVIMLKSEEHRARYFVYNYMVWINSGEFYIHDVENWDIETFVKFHELRAGGLTIENIIGFFEL